ncbi:hypothetical protein AAV98_09545 [Bacillus sp. CHD6a]|nr:hypothetical protein AAV98_09545 [Bacillus sp. CHD6a]
MPLGKRSLLRKSTAVFKRKIKPCAFQWPGIAEEAPAASPGKRSHLRKSTAAVNQRVDFFKGFQRRKGLTDREERIPTVLHHL